MVLTAQTLLPELVERLKSQDPRMVVGVLETANSVLKRCGFPVKRLRLVPVLNGSCLGLHPQLHGPASQVFALILEQLHGS